MESSIEQPIATTPAPPQRIAPLWHTAILVVLVLGTSFLGTIGARHGHMGEHHMLNYALTLGWEWLLLAFTWWGIRLRGHSLRLLLGERRASIEEWMKDIGFAGVFWIGAVFILGGLAFLLRLAHVQGAQKNAAQLAPNGIKEMVMWLALSITAGICEELIFRGYLQQQFTRLSGQLWLGIAASAIFFGAGHGYEGISGMLLITVYGTLFSLLAWQRRSLRPGMMAHAWHDSITGFVLAALKHLGKI